MQGKNKYSRKVLRFPTVVMKSNRSSAEVDEINEVSFDELQLNNLTQAPVSCKHDGRSRLCFSERQPRPRPDREWSPMSIRDYSTKSVKHKYGTDGLYSKRVDNLYQILTRENSIILPPIETSRRIKNNIYDDDKLKEKRYIMRNIFSEGKMARFARDQCYMPSVYTECLNCKTCKRSYMNNKYIEEYKRRNFKVPNCSNSLITRKVHFCDVLGKRYCAACIETENRRFSKRIEERYKNKLSDSDSSITDLCSEFS